MYIGKVGAGVSMADELEQVDVEPLEEQVDVEDIEERPKDANGVPYYLGDRFKHEGVVDSGIFEVIGLGDNRVFYQGDGPITYAWANKTVHVEEANLDSEKLAELLSALTEAIERHDAQGYEEAYSNIAAAMKAQEAKDGD